MKMDAFVENLNHVMEIKNGDYIVDNSELLNVVDFWITEENGDLIIGGPISTESEKKRLLQTIEENEDFREGMIKGYKQKKKFPDEIKVCAWEGKRKFLFGISHPYELFLNLQKIQSHEEKKFKHILLEGNEKIVSFFKSGLGDEFLSVFGEVVTTKKRKKKS